MCVCVCVLKIQKIQASVSPDALKVDAALPLISFFLEIISGIEIL